MLPNGCPFCDKRCGRITCPYEENEVSKPYFDQIMSIIKLRKKYPDMDKILRAYTALHNRGEYEDYARNMEFAELLNDVKIIQPNVEKAIEDEKELFQQHLIEMDMFYISKTGQSIRHLELGGWWYELLGNPETIYLPSGPVQIETSYDYDRNYSEGHGDGICSSKANDKIRATLIGELTHNEALAKHRGERESKS